jgi:hypothetical protein
MKWRGIRCGIAAPHRQGTAVIGWDVHLSGAALGSSDTDVYDGKNQCQKIRFEEPKDKCSKLSSILEIRSGVQKGCILTDATCIFVVTQVAFYAVQCFTNACLH